MTLFNQVLGKRVPWVKKLTTTSEFTIVTADDNSVITLDSLRAAGDGTATNFSFWIDDGTTDYYLINGKSVDKDNPQEIRDHHIPLKSGWSFKCSAGTANHIDVTAVYTEATPSPQANGRR